MVCSIESTNREFSIDTSSQVSILLISLVRKWDINLFKNKRMSNSRTENGSKLIMMGDVLVDAFMLYTKCKDVIFVVTQIDSLCIIGMNIIEEF